MSTADRINDVRRKINEVLTKEDNRITVGWRPPTKDYKEGDVWTDAEGKKWTIKNGIKQNVTKLDTAKTYRDWETDRKSTRLNSSHRL